jgi:hypothetical protein
MRCRRPVRRGALAGAVAIALAVAAAGCGREGGLADSDTTTTQTGTTPKKGRDDPFAKPTAADDRLRATAVRHARRRFGVATRSADVTLRRSRRNPAWAIASGAERRTLWVVWLKDGKVELATTNVRRFNPPSVPCDLRPAFSEPGC